MSHYWPDECHCAVTAAPACVCACLCGHLAQRSEEKPALYVSSSLSPPPSLLSTPAHAGLVSEREQEERGERGEGEGE